MYNQTGAASASICTKNTALGVETIGQKPSPVSACLGRLISTQGETHDLLETLRQRLEGVMRPPYPQKEGANDAQAAESPLCEEITNRIGSAEYINTRIRDLLERLTV